MNDLLNEICLYILMFLSYCDLLILSRVSKRFYFLCNHRNDFKQLVNRVWNLYSDKRLFFRALDNCCLRKSFSRPFKSRQYLVSCLEKKLLSSFEQLQSVSVFFHLINCNRKIRSVNKCVSSARGFMFIVSQP